MTTVAQLVESNADAKPYWEAAKQGRLVFKKCLDCGHVQFPPRHVCPKCWSSNMEWITSRGSGEVYSFSIVRRAPTPADTARVPYVIAVIELADAARMIANIVGDDALDVRIGDLVRVVFEPRDGAMLPQFQRIRT